MLLDITMMVSLAWVSGFTHPNNIQKLIY